MSTTKIELDAWLAAARGDLAHAVDRTPVSPRFDWDRVAADHSRRRWPRLGRVELIPVAVVMLIVVGLAVGWALTRKVARPAAATGQLLGDLARSHGAVGEGQVVRARTTGATRPSVIEERPVRHRRRVQQSAAPMPASPSAPNVPDRGGEYTPTVIIVKPPARLPPLFSPEAYRKQH